MATHENVTGWAVIPNTNGFYSASRCGMIRRNTPTRILECKSDSDGYRCFVVAINKVHRGMRVSHAVLLAHGFERPSQKHEANHKNGVRTDNRIENLEWCTQIENMRHRFDVLGHGFKLTHDAVRKIRQRIAAGEMNKTIAADYGVRPQTVSAIKCGIKWSRVR